MTFQVVEMIHTGGGDSLQLILSMYFEFCFITPDQKLPAYWMILRLWFFVLNVTATMMISFLIISNKILAGWYNPMEVKNKNSDKAVLLEDKDEDVFFYALPFKGLVPMFSN
uniref:Uncharacterized protein n=1 Tax=Caenorhabditis japonica TaxID=281687 RepID=A0A8R1EU74_CAEJA